VGESGHAEIERGPAMDLAAKQGVNVKTCIVYKRVGDKVQTP